MRAVNNYIIIKGIKEEQKTDSGFIIQDNTEFRYLKGQVISVGERTEAIKLDDIVYYDRHAGHEVIFDDNTYIVIKQQDIVIVE